MRTRAHEERTIGRRRGVVLALAVALFAAGCTLIVDVEKLERPGRDAGGDGSNPDVRDADADARPEAEVEVEAGEDADADAATCDPAICAEACVSLGYAGGDCVGGGCACDAGGDADADAPDDAGREDAGGCTPATSVPFNVVPAAADGDERPVSLRSGAGFVFFGRPPGPTSADGLRFQRVNLDGSAAGVAVWTLSSVEISPFHPLVELPSGSFATAFQVPEGAGPGVWLKIVPSSGSGGEVPRQVPGTDARSGEPTITFDGTDLVVAWSHADGDGVRILVQHFVAATGVAIGSPVVVAAGRSGTGEPRIAWGTTRHALAYYDASHNALEVLSLDGRLVVLRDDVLPPPAGHAFVGYPALAWNGTEFGLAWETRSATEARIHLATFMPGAAPVEHDVLSGVALSGTDLGQVSLAWGDRTGEWGIAWRRAETTRAGIVLARIDAIDFHTIEGPVDIRPEATAAFHPSLAYNDGYYMVSWVEDVGYGSMRYPIFVATRGCTP